MIDLHCHVLPGIDDGAPTFEVAVAMCRLAAADGCDTLITTPHQRHAIWPNDDRERLHRLRQELQEKVGPRPRLLAGAEIRVDDELLAEVDELPAGSLLPLAGSRYLLIELDRHRAHPAPAELVHELAVAGWFPIVAHPEHYPWLVAQPLLVERMVAAGALFQITAASLTGVVGNGPRATCRELLDAGFVHFVASDSHGVDRRPPGLSAAFRALAAGWGEPLAVALTSTHPGAVVAHQPLPRTVPA